MGRLQLCIVLGLALQIHLPEHVQSRLFTVLTKTRSALCLDGSNQLPATFISLEAERLTIVTCSNDFVLAAPQQTLERQQLGRDGDDGAWWLIRSARVDNGNAAVVRRESEAVSAGREGDRVDPTGRVIQELSANSVERQPLTPCTGIRSLVNALDEGREDSSMSIGRTGGKKNGIGVPGDARDGATNRLLQVLRHPPIVLLFEVTDRNNAVTGAHGKLGFIRRPTDKGRSSADSKQDQSWLVTGRGRLPDEGISI